MKILIIDQFGGNKTIDTEIIPRIGDKVDMFYTPAPTVTCVLLYPSKNTLKSIGLHGEDITAIVTVA
jgi:hypothetical protein